MSEGQRAFPLPLDSQSIPKATRARRERRARWSRIRSAQRDLVAVAHRSVDHEAGEVDAISRRVAIVSMPFQVDAKVPGAAS